jgi:sugar lactone lactonase YvrE
MAIRRMVAATAITAITAAAAAIVAPVVIASPAAAAATAANVAGTGTILSGSGFSRWGTPATITASVYPANPVAGEPVAKGTVSFFDGAKLLVSEAIFANGTAMLVNSSLAPGLHSITAVYSGDANYAGNTSDPFTQQVFASTNFTSPHTLSGVVGSPLTFTVQTTGFPPPLLLAAGNLDGLKLTDHGDGTATLAGSPLAAGTFSFSISAGSIVNPVTTQFLTLMVTVKPLSITTTALPPAYTGQPYTATLAGTGGVPPFTWSVASGHLPAGVTLNAKTGVLSGTPTAAGTAGFTVQVTDSSSPTKRIATKALSLQTKGIVPAVYAANGANDSVTSYPLSAGNVPPATRLAGLGQGLNGPAGIVINNNGRLYVANSGANTITEYDRGATTPTVTISGSNTGLTGPAGITLDTGGLIYVANRAANSVSVFGSGASGNVAPFFTIAGPDTGLSSPAAVAIDGAGHLWVANASSNTLTAYLAGSSGDAKPFTRIAGPATGLNEPQGLAVDADDNLLAVNTFGESVTSYPLPLIGPATNPNVAPIRTITGSSTGLSFPDGIDIDSSGRIYVANQFDNDITTYAAGANGNAAPVATIAGGNTGLAGPGAIAVTPPLSVLTATLPTARVGRTYRTALRAGQGTSPYAWLLTRGSLPPGLWLGRDGTIGGSPRRSGRWGFTVRVTDGSHPRAVATRSFVLMVAGR